MSANSTSSNGPLEAAQKIVSDLEGLTNEQLALAVKFAMETLGLQLPSSAAPSTTVQVQSTPTVQHASAKASPQRTDIKSFAAAKAPKSDQQFVAVVAYYYQFEAPEAERKNSIDAATMKEATRQVGGRKQVKDWNMTLNNALRSGFLDRAERGTFKLNAVGENLVAITLPGDAGNGTRNGGGSKKTTAKQRTAGKKTVKNG